MNIFYEQLLLCIICLFIIFFIRKYIYPNSDHGFYAFKLRLWVQYAFKIWSNDTFFSFCNILCKCIFCKTQTHLIACNKVGFCKKTKLISEKCTFGEYNILLIHPIHLLVKMCQYYQGNGYWIANKWTRLNLFS